MLQVTVVSDTRDAERTDTMKLSKTGKELNTGGPPKSRIQYPRFQLSAVYRGPKIRIRN